MKRMLEEELVPAVIKHGDVLDKIGKARREKMNQEKIGKFIAQCRKEKKVLKK